MTMKTDTQETKINTKAREARGWFEYLELEGQDGRWVTKTDRPDWVVDMVYNAQSEVLGGGIFPDDFIYSWVVEALDSYEEEEHPEDAEPAEELYTHTLLKWVGSDLSRFEAASDLIKNGMYANDNNATAIMSAIHDEKITVYESVLDSLNDLVEEDE